MKHLFTLLIILSTVLGFGQVENFTEFDCNSQSQSVYEVGDAGMPLIVASKGFDCGICVNQAPAVAAFANQYVGQIQVWGAMRYLFSSTTPGCPAVNNWVSNYSWENVFSFADMEGHWSGNGTPIYYVIHPQTREIVYQGSNFTTAKNQALSLLALSAPSIYDFAQSIAAFANDSEIVIRLDAINSGNSTIRVMNIVGQEVAVVQRQIVAGQNTIRIPFNGNNGIYLLNIAQGEKTGAHKFAIAR